MESFILPLLLIQYAMNSKERIKDINDNQIFIVEDNEMHSLMMDYLLSKETTAHIKKFRSGEDCIKSLDLNPDVVILDYGLPGMNGIQTLKAIKEYDSDIPVIVITGNTDKAVARSFFNAGVYDYIEKNDDAFEQVSKVTDSILNIMAWKEAKKERRKKIIMAIVVSVITTAIGILFYFILKH